MKHIYAVEKEEELLKYREFVNEIQPQVDKYIDYLKREFQVMDLPKTVVWTSGGIATEGISDIPVPAYTNEFRIVITSDIEAWRSIYLKQLDHLKKSKENEEMMTQIRSYYNTALTRNHILKILGHELAHHSELFLDDFHDERSNGIWFEEGMVEYISRRYFLSKEEFEAEALINQQLVMLFKEYYGNHSLEEFGKETYQGNYASIFFEYWRSFLAIKQIVAYYNGDVDAVFRSYHEWNETGAKQTLTEWFHVCI